MGEADLEHIAETPEGCIYRVANPIPVEHPERDDSFKQYVARPRLESMCMVVGIGDSPEEAKSDLAINLAAMLAKFREIKTSLNEFDQALKDELSMYFAELEEPCAEAETSKAAPPADAGAAVYDETPETMEHAEDEALPPYGKDAAESPLDKAPALPSVDELLLSYSASLMKAMRRQAEEGWMYNPLNREKEPPKIIVVPR